MKRTREQKLVDIAVSMVMLVASDDFTETDPEKIGQWVREQLNGCGVPCYGPVGTTHVVLGDDV